MVVLDNCLGLNVTIISNNTTLKEDAADQAGDEPKTVTTYVEVDNDGAFEVNLQFTDQYTCRFGVCVEIRLDRHKVYDSLYRSSQLRESAGLSCAGIRSKIRGKWHISNFLFSKFVLGECPCKAMQRRD